MYEKAVFAASKEARGCVTTTTGPGSAQEPTLYALARETQERLETVRQALTRTSEAVRGEPCCPAEGLGPTGADLHAILLRCALQAEACQALALGLARKVGE
jgi:hypothetical protein